MKTLEFGRYIFNKFHETNELEWIVLEERDDGSLLLLCRYCIERFQYDYKENHAKNPRWENGIIRSWLNDYFLNYAFTIREKEKLIPIPVTTPNGRILTDKVILFNAEEVERYLPDASDRQAAPTEWAKRHSDIPEERLHTEKGHCGWFLRDPSTLFKGNFTYVRSNGKIDLNGGDFYLGGAKGLRPVILLKP